MRFSLIVMVVLVAAVPLMTVRVGAQSIGVSERYAECMRRARADPERGLEMALSWRDGANPEQRNPEQRNNAAAHCEAVALTGLGRFVAAAKRLEALAGSMKAPSKGGASMGAVAPKSVRAEILAQAGQAWSRADQIARARAVQTAAVALDPNNAEIRIDRAMTRAADGAYWEAIDDLDVAISLNRKGNRETANAYALRASAYRFLDVLSLAKQDADTALRLAPDNAEALLEMVIIMHMAGDEAAARKAWDRLVQAHDGSPAAEAAQRNLKKLDQGNR